MLTTNVSFETLQLYSLKVTGRDGVTPAETKVLQAPQHLCDGLDGISGDDGAVANVQLHQLWAPLHDLLDVCTQHNTFVSSTGNS